MSPAPPHSPPDPPPEAGAAVSRPPTATPPAPAPRSATSARERRTPYPGWRSEDVLRAAALVIAIYVALRLLWFAHLLILTAFLGMLFGLAVTAGVDRLQRWRIPRGVAAAGITFGTLGLIGGFFAWSAPTLQDQSRELATKLPEAIDKIDAWSRQHRGGILHFLLTDSSSATRAPTAGTPPSDTTATPRSPRDSAAALPASRADTGTVARRPAPSAAPSAGAVRQPPPHDTTGTDGASPLRRRLMEQLSGAKRYFFGFLTSTLAVLSGVLLVIFLTIYIAADPDLYHDGLMHLFPHRWRRRAGEVLTEVAAALRKWLVSQLLAMLAIGIATTVVLLLLRVRAAFPLGVIAALLEFIPTIGPILGAVPAVAMGFVDSPEKALWVIVAYTGVQLFENHILIPLLMKEGVDLPPALTILSQALMALIFGFMGLLVAVPMLAAITVAVKMLYVEDVVGDPVETFTELDDHT